MSAVTGWGWMWILLAVAGLLLLCLAAVRFFTLRSRGTAVIVRRMPAAGTHGWRHGVMRYNGEFVEYYKLRSLAPSYDLKFNRLDIEITGSRPLTDDEVVFISPDATAMQFSVAGVDFEAAFDSRAATAFSAWVESAPSARQERVDFQTLRRHIERPRGTNMPQDPASWPSYFER